MSKGLAVTKEIGFCVTFSLEAALSSVKKLQLLTDSCHFLTGNYGCS